MVKVYGKKARQINALDSSLRRVRAYTWVNEKVGFIIPTTRTRTFSMSARRFSEVGAVQFRCRVGIGILLGWLGV